MEGSGDAAAPQADEPSPNDPGRSPIGSDSLDAIREGSVPSWLKTSASIGWRVLIVVGLIIVSATIINRLRVVFIPLILALLIAAALAPPARWLMHRGWPPLLATWTILLVVAGTLGTIGWLLAPRFADGFDQLTPTIGDAYDDIESWLIDGPLNLDQETVDEMENTVRNRAADIVETQFTSRVALVLEIATAFFLTLVVSFFYIKDGDRFRDLVLRRFPQDERGRVEATLAKGWWVLQRYLAGTIVVGAVDALAIGAGLAIIGVPLVVPIMVLTFFAAFFPLVGAIGAGAVATLLALATGGVGEALLVLGLTVVVQQVDGDVVAPIVYSRALDLHPLAILLAITAGGVIAGVLGALLAVPLLAATMAMRAVWLDEAAPG